jgi:thiol-disulfide isomerase/thioredoxin
MALACSHQTAPTGKAKLTGKFAGAFPDEQTFAVIVKVPNLLVGISKQFDEYEIHREPDGSFSLSIPLFCDAYGMFAVNGDESNTCVLSLSPDKETKIELSLDEEKRIQAKVIKGTEFTTEETNKSNLLYLDFYERAYSGSFLDSLRYDMTPEAYRDYILHKLKKELLIIEKNQEISDDTKQILYRIMKLAFSRQLFDYEGEVRYLYEKQQPEKEVNTPDFTPLKPDKSYYSFLAFLDMNNPPLSNYPFYPRIYNSILSNKVLNIPQIDSKPFADWLKEVKTIMAPLVGSDTGLFYDLLTLHAYLQQFGESKPLSTGQVAEIKSFFKNPTYTDFIFAENDTLLKQAYSSNADNKKTVESIVSSYKGKVVVIDFWATWCGPCLQAMEDMKPMKAELKNKDVVFVYITDTSSPEALWKEKIQEIGGEQYYLTDKEWERITLSDKYGFNGIPTYLIFDANGELKNKFSGFPGVEEMRKMIEKLLP